MKRRGFTIVELLMVIGIIGVLLGIVTTAASGAIKNSRKRRTSALCTLVQTGLATYHAQNEEWPIDTDNFASRAASQNNHELSGGGSDSSKYVLSGSETKECIYKMVMETKNNRPVMDVTGLFVSKQEGKSGQNCSGMDFLTAIRGSRHNPTKLKPSGMYFGYPDEATGRFRHFRIVYSVPSDSMTVHKQYDSQSWCNDVE